VLFELVSILFSLLYFNMNLSLYFNLVLLIVEKVFCDSLLEVKSYRPTVIKLLLKSESFF
jgi:hypothetical protein